MERADEAFRMRGSKTRRQERKQLERKVNE